MPIESSSVTAEVAVPVVSDDDDYGYNETGTDVTQCGIVETKASSYLADPDRSLGMLHKYPLVKSAFIHFNTWAPARGSRVGKRPPWKKSGWAWPTLEILAVV